MRSSSVLALILALAGCDSTRSPAAPQPGGVATSPPLASPTTSPSSAPTPSFGFDRVESSCNSFSAHITNPTKTAWLDVYVDVRGLDLAPGEHELAIDGSRIQAMVTELPQPFEGEWSCTDFGGGPPKEILARWKATSGKLHVRLHLPEPGANQAPQDGRYDRADLALDGVEFTDGGGQTRTVTIRFEQLSIGWLPG